MDNSPCIRCGKIRIVAKTWTEQATTYTLTVCPDPQCQKIVEQELQKRDEKRAMIQAKSLERRKNIFLSRKPK